MVVAMLLADITTGEPLNDALMNGGIYRCKRIGWSWWW